MKNNKKFTWYIALAALLIGLGMGWLFFGSHMGHAPERELGEHSVYTCAMHPQIRQSEPGNCPICGMQLTPLQSASHSLEIQMSPTAMQLADVRTSKVERSKPVRTIRLNGRIAADERMVYSQSSHLDGRVEQLHVATTGELVQQGEVLAYLYSPELVTAQKELLEAYRYSTTQPALFQAARNKLMHWKLSDRQIDRILETGETQDHFPILADVSGVVLTKNVQLGDYVNRGSALFEIADLRTVWVLFDVYERDLRWVKKGDRVRFEIQSIPGSDKNGLISFIDPVIDPKTRVATARVEFPNPGMQLKPDMFVKGMLESERSELAESLTIPRSAVMWTGERSVVYVKQRTDVATFFQMREVQLGPSLGDRYVILQGLKEGEEVASSGTFSIDAAAQLAGKPSMMMRPDPMTLDTLDRHALATVSKEEKQILALWIHDYITLKDLLVLDKLKDAQDAARSLFASLNAQKALAERIGFLSVGKPLETLSEGKDIGASRQAFMGVSERFIALSKAIPEGDQSLFVLWCPMANDNKGASWLSDQRLIRNPYFGKSMLSCGSVIDSIE